MNSKANPVTWFEIPTNIDSVLTAVEKNGGTVVPAKAGGGEHGWIAQFQDPEGNVVALYSDES